LVNLPNRVKLYNKLRLYELINQTPPKRGFFCTIYGLTIMFKRIMSMPLHLAVASCFVYSLSASTLYAAESFIPDHQLENPWFIEGAQRIQDKANFIGMPAPKKSKPIKNVILFIGDGMGVSTVTAARILEGQLLGKLGEEHDLSFDLFPFTALSKTYNVDAQTPDSAGTMSAIMTGVKTNISMFGVDQHVTHNDCASMQDHELVTALELAELAGQSTGIVSTTRITHATPAATYAKTPNRNWEDDSVMTQAAKDQGCKDIATQLVNFEKNLKKRYPQSKKINGIEVVLGGGRAHFKDNRQDGKDLIQQWQQEQPKGQYITTAKEFAAIDTEKTNQLFGLFNDSHMAYENPANKSNTQEPSLSEMATTAVDILDKNSAGYFLMVEAGRIDHGHHAGNAYQALHETINLSQAVAATLNRVDLSETLILVTADHSHVMTISGYPKRGNPILGKVVKPHKDSPALAFDQMPYTTLGYMNGPGAYIPVAKNSKARRDISEKDTEAHDYLQQSLVPLGSETHGGEDVTIYGQGRGSALVSGTLEESAIFHIMQYLAPW